MRSVPTGTCSIQVCFGRLWKAWGHLWGSNINGLWNMSGVFTAWLLLLPFWLMWFGCCQDLILQKYSLLQTLFSMCEKCNAPHVTVPPAPEGPESVFPALPFGSVFTRPLFRVWWLIQIKCLCPDVSSCSSGFSSTMFLKERGRCKFCPFFCAVSVPRLAVLVCKILSKALDFKSVS